MAPIPIGPTLIGPGSELIKDRTMNTVRAVPGQGDRDEHGGLERANQDAAFGAASVLTGAGVNPSC